MRTRLFALVAVAATLALAGCTGDEPEPDALPPVRIVDEPAASAGGSCILWDYAFIEDELGVTFSVAASDQVDDTSTCVVQTADPNGPYLMLSVVASTTADAALFRATSVPDKATSLKGLGQAGYRLIGKASKKSGPWIEVGWLSEADQLQSLKFTFAPDATTEEVSDMAVRLVTLARAMDTVDGDAETKK